MKVKMVTEGAEDSAPKDIRGQILQALRQRKGKASLRTLAECVKMQINRLKAAIHALVDEGIAFFNRKNDHVSLRTSGGKWPPGQRAQLVKNLLAAPAPVPPARRSKRPAQAYA